MGGGDEGAGGGGKRRAKGRLRAINLTILGIQFPVAMGIGYVWGRAMDKWLGTFPWLTIAFFLCGVAAGFLNLFRMTRDVGGDGDGG